METSTAKNILVTGAGGFLGRYIVKALLKKGHQVVGLGRTKHQDLIDQGVRWVQADIRDLEKTRLALKDIDTVFHCASKVAMWGEWDEFESINVQGTQNLLTACLENNVKKFIYTSTPSVVFGQDSINGGDEKLPYPTQSLSLYGKSKAIAEKNVLDIDQSKLLTCAIRPHLIFGPGDDHLVPRLVQAARDNKLKIIGNGENLVDVIAVENAAEAHILAFENISPSSPICGQAYFVAQDKPVKLWDFTNHLLKIHGTKPVTKTISFKLAYFVGWLCETVAKIIGYKKDKLPMTRFVAMQLSKSHWFYHAKAQNDFGYKPLITTEQALKNYQDHLEAGNRC